ncbi:MAG TPA: TonB family protein [Armatimonadota bacterium]
MNPRRQLAIAFSLSLLINGLLLGGLYRLTWAAVGTLTRVAAQPQMVVLHYQAPEAEVAASPNTPAPPPISEPLLPMAPVAAPRNLVAPAPVKPVPPAAAPIQAPVIAPPQPRPTMPEPERKPVIALPPSDPGGSSPVAAPQPAGTGGGARGDAPAESGHSQSTGHPAGPSGETSGSGQGVTAPSHPMGGSGDTPGKTVGGNSTGSGQPTRSEEHPVPERPTNTTPAVSPRAGTAPPSGNTTTTPGVRRAARVTKSTKPPYPDDARQAYSEGTVVLRVTLDTQGRVTDVEVVESAGDSRLDLVAVRVVKKSWVFEPKLVDGNPVVSTIMVRIPFSLTK